MLSGGCGGGNNNILSQDTGDGSNEDNLLVADDSFIGRSVSLELDSDGDNKPDVLDFDGAAQFYIKNRNDSGNLSASGVRAASVEGEVPFMVWVDELGEVTNPNEIKAYLEAGTDYTLEFSKNFTESLYERLPHIEVLDPANVIISMDNIALSIYPYEKPVLICLTFTPGTSGFHTIRLSNANPLLSEESETDGVLFVYKEMHNEAGENGYPMKFNLMNYDGSESNVSIRNIIELRKKFLEANPFYIDDVYGEASEAGTRNRNNRGAPITENTQGYDDYMEFLSARNRIMSDLSEVLDEDALEERMLASERIYAAGGKLSASDIQIESTMKGIPYDKDYDLGVGFLAISNLQALSNALDTRDGDLEDRLIEPKRNAVQTRYTCSFIDTAEEYANMVSKNFNLSLSKNASGASSSVESSSNYKLGHTSTTLVVHFEETETKYHYLSFNGLFMKNAAKRKLANNKSSFREEYGDYFVSGYLNGAVFDAYVTITGETTEEVKKASAALSASFQTTSMDASGKISLSKEMETKINNESIKIAVEIRHIGAGSWKPTTSTDVGTKLGALQSVSQELYKFRSYLADPQNKDKKYAPVKVMLDRYRELYEYDPDSFDLYLPISVSHARDIELLNQELVTLRGYKNTLNSGKEDMAWDDMGPSSLDKDCSDLLSEVVRRGNKLYSNHDDVKKYLADARALNKRLRAMCERYEFFNSLVKAQQTELQYANYPARDKPFGPTRMSGYPSYMASSAVQSDIDAGKKVKMDNYVSYKSGYGYYARPWEPEFTAQTDNGSSDAIFCYWEFSGQGDDGSTERNITSSYAVGKKEAKFHFDTAWWLNPVWTLQYQSMRYNRTLYPFGKPGHILNF